MQDQKTRTVSTCRINPGVLFGISWWTFRNFFLFPRGGGEGGAEVPGEGGGGFIENPRKGGLPGEGGCGGRGAGVSAGNSGGRG